MKIAFVGKGGSGKSTAASLFIDHLIGTNRRVLAVDADINQHLASLLGVTFDATMAVSDEANSEDIRKTLANHNPRVNPLHMVKTTPPGRGSHLISLCPDDPILQKYSVAFGDGRGYFMHVGTYVEDGIGTSCYHGNLAVFENIVSHTNLGESEWLVADMVAGTDAFAGALYLMFDVIVLVVEPTPESVGVYRQFMQLARASGVDDRVLVVANKVMDEEDVAFLANELGARPGACFAYDAQLKRARQRGGSITSGSQQVVCTTLEHAARAMAPDKAARLHELHELHLRYSTQDYVMGSHGDLRGQIDEDFRL